MQPTNRRSFAIALVFCFIALFLAARTQGFQDIRMVQLLLIFVAGVNAGVALTFLKAFIRMRG